MEGRSEEGPDDIYITFRVVFLRLLLSEFATPRFLQTTPLSGFFSAVFLSVFFG